MIATKIVRVLIADDHPIVRQGLELVINSQPDMEVVGQAADGAEVVQLFMVLEPDVVVMDLQMPVKDGLAAIMEIRQTGVDSKILGLTSFPEDDMVFGFIQAGASGIMLKDAPSEHLLDAIRAVAQGESALHPRVVQKLIQRVQQSSAPSVTDYGLTPRELEVLKFLAAGLSNRAIATKLSISTRTVTTHVRNILDKLELENRTQAALFAVAQGIV
jgi:DNA-binding NarL/FixJ family response regulator